MITDFYFTKKNIYISPFKQGPYVIDWLSHLFPHFRKEAIEVLSSMIFPSLPASFSPLSLNLKPHCILQTPHFSCGWREWCNYCWLSRRNASRGVQASWNEFGTAGARGAVWLIGCGAAWNPRGDWQKPPGVPRHFDGVHMWNCPGCEDAMVKLNELG